ncbi:hypothetical protein DFH09DRAFT_396186 [Mycena vulgaris]|nr:hypothetical protein DFH09DRAFT_396186 [Mycena vulgaris]
MPDPIFNLLGLPPELIILILQELPVADLWHCEQANNRMLRNIIRQSTVLQYGTAKELAAVEDTQYSVQNYRLVERADHLAAHQRAWLDFTHTHTHTISVDHVAAEIYDLTSDMYFLGGVPDPLTAMATSLRYARIQGPDLPQDSDWAHFEVGKPVVDFATAIEQHNLVAVVTYSPHENDPTWFSVDIVLLDFTTQESHALAAQPILHVHDVESFRQEPYTTIDIAGDILFLVIQYPGYDQTDLDTLHIYQWTRGIARMDPAAVSNIGVGATFLAADTILVPNGKTNCMDVYCIPPDSSATMVHSLLLPRLHSSYSITSFTCNGAPNFMGSAVQPKPPSWNRRRYTSNAGESLIFAVLEIADDDDDDDDPDELGFLFHRSTLLYILGNRLKAGKIRTPWSVWGPSITRWFDTTQMATPLLNMTHGQRFVWLRRTGWETPDHIHVLDFNPHTVGMAMSKAEQNQNGLPQSTTSTTRVVGMTDRTMLAHPAFRKPVESFLPYVETISVARFDYDAVAMTEDSIVGIKLADSPTMMLSSLEVLRFD